MRATPADLRRRRDELVLRIQQVDDAASLFAEASTRLRRIVPFDRALWMATDPGTGLPTAPTVLDSTVSEHGDHCADYWRQELLVGDVNLFRDLARATVPAAALRGVDGGPERSARYRSILRPLGLDDELRAVLRVGDSPWGVVSLWRHDGRPPFSDQETRLVAGLSAPLGEALRVRARPSGADGGLTRPDRPGLLLFDRDGALVSVNEPARVWLAELPPSDLGRPTDLGVTLPMWLMAVVFGARSGRDGDGDGTARARVRTRSGRWLVCHASCLVDARDGDGDTGDGTTAVVIEPATRAEVAPVIVDAYDLSEREQQITRLIARGVSNPDIAGELFLSAHTVRDHVKAIYRKVDVSSRGELVAKLFTEHHWPVHRADVVAVTGE